LAPTDFVRRWLEGNDPRYEVVRRLRERGKPIPSTLYEIPAGIHFEAHAEDAISDAEVRVAYRVVGPSNDRPASGPSGVESLRRSAEGAWRLVARAQILQPRGGSIYLLPPEFAALFDR
jgi:hypothetical protein